jgi:hypothetical protein
MSKYIDIFENNALNIYKRDKLQQYVVYDFNFYNYIDFYSADSRGDLVLPYIFTDEDGNQACHSTAVFVPGSMTFECSTGYDDDSQDSDTIVTMTYYREGSTDCDSDQYIFQYKTKQLKKTKIKFSEKNSKISKNIFFVVYWWEEGYSPYYDPDTLIPVTSSICNNVDACESLNYTRSDVVIGSGQRYDFSCEGEPQYTTFTLCDSGHYPDPCGEYQDYTFQCGTVSAALGAACITTSNSTY